MTLLLVLLAWVLASICFGFAMAKWFRWLRD